MKKNISKEQIIETALELMKNKNDLRGLNMREIARTLGCAHTNIYNYFPAYSDLLWETHAVLHEGFMEMLTKRLEAANNAEMRLDYFFSAFVDTYMDNKGWFRLAWHEHIEGERPQRDIDVLDATNKVLTGHISDICKEFPMESPDADTVKRVLHNTHCYIVGEISNYLLGRGLTQNEQELRAYITREAINMFRSCLASL
ncbi:MAG TPA: TetR/AcrR family transcriptional regulator [Ruminococcaceae bacterium]|nr:TetR/AcrR family transcriptional regulator [Oscillospiraceae bacterium]